MKLKEHSLNELQLMSARVRRSVVEMAHDAGKAGAHLGGSLSCVEILTALYGSVFHFDTENPLDSERDRFLTGKAHCILAQYSVMQEVGIITEEEKRTFRQDGGLLMGYPKVPRIGLEYSGGTLGMPLSVGVGMALDAKQKGRKNKVYVLIGDGECNEGIIWEAVMTATKYRLSNLIIVVDRNRLQLSGTTEDVMDLGDLGAKFQAFGCYVQNVDGHSIEALQQAYRQVSQEQVNVVVAHTVKGKGISFVEDHVEWHQNQLSDDLYQKAIAELEGKAE
ncbi:transketolase [Hominifimenecus sp. rT4P-3]|uniref:transketolase n=1 Tax=Hominifimenecus sp. rT4P-3 TaxID=3242979 RepID=UPI003DA48C4F